MPKQSEIGVIETNGLSYRYSDGRYVDVVGVYEAEGGIRVFSTNDETYLDGDGNPQQSVPALRVDGKSYLDITGKRQSAIPISTTNDPALKILSWPEIVAWWDSAYGLTLSGAQVTAWADRKHGFVAAQAMASRRPTFSATGFGGAPGVVLDGADDHLVCEDPALLAMLPAGDAPGEIFALSQQDAPPADTSQRMAVAYGGPLFDAQRRLRRAVVAGVNRAAAQVGVGGGNAHTPTDGYVDLSSRHVLHGVFGATLTSIEVDGGAATTAGAVPETGATRFVIGATAADFAGNFWQGPQRDIVLVSGALDADKKAFLQSTLMDRRNI